MGEVFWASTQGQTGAGAGEAERIKHGRKEDGPNKGAEKNGATGKPTAGGDRGGAWPRA